MSSLIENWSSTGTNAQKITVTNLPSIGIGINMENTSSTGGINFWGTPQRVDIIENIDSIEFIYKEQSIINYGLQRVFKIVYSCIDGKWNKSERIYGEIVPSQKEFYKF